MKITRNPARVAELLQPGSMTFSSPDLLFDGTQEPCSIVGPLEVGDWGALPDPTSSCKVEGSFDGKDCGLPPEDEE